MAGAGAAGSVFVRRKTVTAHNDATMRTVADFGEFGRVTLDEPVPHGGTGQGPSPLQAVLGTLCGCEAVTFHRTAAELGLRYESLDFEAAFTIDIRGRQGDRSVRPHFQTVRVRAVIACADRLVPQARSMQTWPWPVPRACCRKASSSLGGWKTEKVWSYHSACPSYRVAPEIMVTSYRAPEATQVI